MDKHWWTYTPTTGFGGGIPAQLTLRVNSLASLSLQSDGWYSNPKQRDGKPPLGFGVYSLEDCY